MSTAILLHSQTQQGPSLVCWGRELDEEADTTSDRWAGLAGLVKPSGRDRLSPGHP